MKVELDIINTMAEWLIAVTLCAASILALSRKQLDNLKYDDALANLTLLCLIFTLIGQWVRVIEIHQCITRCPSSLHFSWPPSSSPLHITSSLAFLKLTRRL